MRSPCPLPYAPQARCSRVQCFKEQDLYQTGTFRSRRDTLPSACLSAISLRSSVKLGYTLNLQLDSKDIPKVGYNKPRLPFSKWFGKKLQAGSF